MSMLFFLNRPEQYKIQDLLLIGILYIIYNHYLTIYEWFTFYQHKLFLISNKSIKFSFIISNIYEQQIELLHITDATRAVLWMFNNDDDVKRQFKSTIELQNSRFFISRLDENDPKDIYDRNTPFNIPSDNYAYTLKNGLQISFLIIQLKDESKIGNIVYKKEYTISISSMTKKHNEIQEIITNNYKDYINWVKSQQQEKKYIFYNYYDVIKKEFIPNCWDCYKFESTKTFNNMFFEHKNELIERLNSYKNDIEIYKKLGIPHSLGLLLHGEPGCGKTSAIKAIANYMNRHIININIKHYKTIQELRNLFLNNALTAYPNITKNKRIYVFEEIDCSTDDIDSNPFLSRSEKTKSANISYDFELFKQIKNEIIDENTDDSKPDISKFNIMNRKNITTGEILELLDGISECDDRIIIFTTNHPELLDKAFMRPGRIDMFLEFKKLRRVDIDDLYNLWFGKRIEQKLLNKIKDYTISQAEMGKMCFQYKKKPSKIIDELLKL